jgi:hypothetical protein
VGIGITLLLFISFYLFFFGQRVKNPLLTGVIGGLFLILYGIFSLPSFLRIEKKMSATLFTPYRNLNILEVGG